MVRVRLAKHPKNGESSEARAAVEATESANGSISKAEAVRKAIAAGHDQPEQGVDYIKREFGLDMGRQHFSSTKSQMKKKSEAEPTAKAPKANPGRKANVAEAQSAPTKAASNGESDLIESLETLKPLI